MAATASPIAMPASVFSSTSLSAVSASNVGASFTSVTVMVTMIVAVRRAVSVAVTVTVGLVMPDSKSSIVPSPTVIWPMSSMSKYMSPIASRL